VGGDGLFPEKIVWGLREKTLREDHLEGKKQCSGKKKEGETRGPRHSDQKNCGKGDMPEAKRDRILAGKGRGVAVAT